MPGGVVCYLERAGGGSMIRRIRLVAAGLSRVWTAPESSDVSSIEGGAGPAVGAAHAGAQWVAQTLAGVGLKRLAAVCADADGSVCAWLSAPTPEPQVIQATINQSSGDADGSGAGVGAARLLSMSSSGSTGSTTDVSMQALATLDHDPEDEAPSLSDRFRKGIRRSAHRAANSKSRYAVLAIPDAPVRVFLDQLDQLGIECEAALSLWHAMAAAWNPPVALPRHSNGDHIVSTAAPSTAVVLVEPTGRLVWAWTLAGELVAGGTMRLASFARKIQQQPTPTDALAVPGDSARRIAEPDPAEDTTATLEFSSAEAGRLVMDWLAWSAQLGHCPQRVVCLACPTLASPDGGGPECLAGLLARIWPNATIDGAVHDDPVGATIARLAGLGPEAEQPAPDENQLPAALRPRAALVGLSARPGRADRSLHRWMALALLAAAAVVAAGAYKVQQSVGAVTIEIGKMNDRRKQVIQELGVALNQPRFGEMLPAQQADLMTSAVKSSREQIAKLRPPRPVLDETVRLLKALDGVEDVKLLDYEVNGIVAVATLAVPEADTGPEILEKLRKSPGMLAWEGTTQASFRTDGKRQYKLTATWPTDAPRAGGSPPR